MFKWNNFSGSLLVRSVYLITLPIVLVQVVGIIIFFELHWDLVLKRSAQSIANEIKILELNKDNGEIDKFANTLQIIRSDQFQKNDPFGHEVEDDEDEPPEEAAFRRAMQKVWAEDAKLAKSLGYTVSAADAFGEEAAGGAQSAKTDPFAFIMRKFIIQ